MNRRLLTDLLMVGVLMGAALCIARGFLQSSIAAFFGAWVLVLGASLIWLESRRVRPLPAVTEKDNARPRNDHFK